MPTYDYRCAKCGEDLEVFQTFAEAPLTKHKGCGGKLAKVLSPAGIVLKGSGFYKTDNRDSSSKRSAARDSKESKESNGKPSTESSSSSDSSSSSSKGSEGSGSSSGSGSGDSLSPGSGSGDSKSSSGDSSSAAKKPAAKSA